MSAFLSFSVCLSAFTAPGVVSVSVSSITASSISLSWSVASGSVASWEVVWRETDRGTESSSGSLTGTSYTIDQLESTTIYTVTVRASNAVGASSSQPITFSTGKHELCSVIVVPCSIIPGSDVQAKSAPSTSESDNTAGIIGGVVAIVVILAGTVIVMFVLFLRSRRGSYSTSSKNRYETLGHKRYLQYIKEMGYATACSFFN